MWTNLIWDDSARKRFHFKLFSLFILYGIHFVCISDLGRSVRRWPRYNTHHISRRGHAKHTRTNIIELVPSVLTPYKWYAPEDRRTETGCATACARGTRLRGYFRHLSCVCVCVHVGCGAVLVYFKDGEFDGRRFDDPMLPSFRMRLRVDLDGANYHRILMLLFIMHCTESA